MPNIEIKQLYNLSRFPQSTSKIVSLLLYLPLGLLLVAVRSVIGLFILLAGFALPNVEIVRNILHKLLCFTFGISINVQNLEKREEVEAFVSNQVSILDHLVLNSITGCVTPGIKLNPLLSSSLGVQYFGSSGNIESFKKNVLDVVSENKVPLYFQPESRLTNGKGVLKFSTWAFELCSKVQPVAVSTYRPFFDISVTAIESSYWSDVLFYLFSPCTVYSLQFLPVSERKGASEIEFSEKIRSDIASVLKVQAVDYTAADLREWEKRYRLDQIRMRQIQPPTPVVGVNPELNRMTLQVKEVLPLVPYNVIYKDLLKTRNVDVTITNILEGHVTYTPEPQSIPKASTSQGEKSVPLQSSASCTNVSTSSGKGSNPWDLYNTAATSFGKSAQERTLSFQVRKQMLIENARKRYIEKHGLNNLVLNNC